MPDALDKALATQLANIQAKTGQSLAALSAALTDSGLSKHGELRAWAMEQFSLGYGDANTLVHVAKQSAGAGPSDGKSDDDLLGQIYSGKKAPLRALHERIVSAISTFGTFEIAPKKAYVSLRRKKQFAMVGPATQTAIEIGINLHSALPANARVKVLPPKGMCQYTVRLSTAQEVDAELLDWLRQAFDAAG